MLRLKVWKEFSNSIPLKVNRKVKINIDNNKN